MRSEDAKHAATTVQLAWMDVPNIWATKGFIAESVEWFIEDQAFLWSHDLAHRPHTSPGGGGGEEPN